MERRALANKYHQEKPIMCETQNFKAQKVHIEHNKANLLNDSPVAIIQYLLGERPGATDNLFWNAF